MTGSEHGSESSGQTLLDPDYDGNNDCDSLRAASTGVPNSSSVSYESAVRPRARDSHSKDSKNKSTIRSGIFVGKIARSIVTSIDSNLLISSRTQDLSETGRRASKQQSGYKTSQTASHMTSSYRVASGKDRKDRPCHDPYVEQDSSGSLPRALTLFARQKHPTNSRHRPKLAGTGDGTAHRQQSRSQKKSWRGGALGSKGQKASSSALGLQADSPIEAQVIPIRSNADGLSFKEADVPSTGPSPTQTQPIDVDTRNQAAIHRVEHKDCYTQSGDRYQLIADT